MGQETEKQHYTKQQEQRFRALLEEETKLLKQWIKDKRFKNSPRICGYEVEGWIIKEQGLPYACSIKLLENVADPNVTPELSKFNFEINGNPFSVNGDLPHRLENDVIKNRASSLQTGSFWQKSFVHKFGKKFDKLIEKY